MMAEKHSEKLVKKIAKDLYNGHDEDSIVDHLMDKGLEESEAYDVIDDANRALQEDDELVADLDWDIEITDVARDLYSGMDQEDLIESLIEDGWSEVDAVELVELASERLNNRTSLRRRFDRELDEEDELFDADGVPASKGMIALGWILAVVGGIIFALIIPILLIASKDRSTSSGFKYDEESRNTGKQILMVAFALQAINMFLARYMFS